MPSSTNGQAASGPGPRYLRAARVITCAQAGVIEDGVGLGRFTTAHCRAKQSMLNAIEAGLDCIEHGEFLVPGEITEYGAGVASSGIMQYDSRVTEQLLEAGIFVSFTMQAGGYDSLVELREKAPTSD